MTQTMAAVNGVGASGAVAPAGVEEVGPESVRQWLADGSAVLVDVREADEHARERIGGATLLALSRFDAGEALSRAGAGRRVVFHCKSGRRSADAARMAAAAAGSGGSGVRVCTMTGGIEAWKGRGLPVVAGGGGARLSVMRQVQLTIGLVTLAGTALGFFVSPWLLLLPVVMGAGLVVAGATGTCGLATVLAAAPWNRTSGVVKSGSSCSSGSCCS